MTDILQQRALAAILLVAVVLLCNMDSHRRADWMLLNRREKQRMLEEQVSPISMLFTSKYRSPRRRRVHN